MNKLLLIPALLFLATPANAQKATEKENVINLIKQFDSVIAKKDSLTLKKILAEDFIGSIPNGQSFDRKSFISYHCSPTSRVREIKEEGSAKWNIKIVKDCAIVNRNVAYLTKTAGGNKPVEIKVKKLEVCVKIKSKWLLASLQGTEVLK
jgi:hypothetical protein